MHFGRGNIFLFGLKVSVIGAKSSLLSETRCVQLVGRDFPGTRKGLSCTNKIRPASCSLKKNLFIWAIWVSKRSSFAGLVLPKKIFTGQQSTTYRQHTSLGHRQLRVPFLRSLDHYFQKRCLKWTNPSQILNDGLCIDQSRIRWRIWTTSLEKLPGRFQ